jgi:2-keto-3-deoxy-L-rhamnonate aldolase RhmA
MAAAELTGMAPIVPREGTGRRSSFLDRGAWGVQVPHVNTAEEARAAVDAVKCARKATGASSTAAGQHGFKGATGDYAKQFNRNTLVCLMLEEVTAIDSVVK